MKTLFSQKSGIALSLALTASVLSNTAQGGPRSDPNPGTASSCCGGTTTPSSPSPSSNSIGGRDSHSSNQDLCVVTPEIVMNDGANIVFRGHIERWESDATSTGREIDTYNQLIRMSVPDYTAMLEKSARPRSTGVFGIGGNDERVVRLGWADRSLSDPQFIDQACENFSNVLGKYNASLIPEPRVPSAKPPAIAKP